MKSLKTKVLATLASITLIGGLGMVTAPAATAGNGNGRICNLADSKGYTYGNLDYLGRGTWYPIPPGTCRGGWGHDMDAVYVPPGKITWVAFNGFGQTTFNQCGRGGFWTKVSDWGASVQVRNC